MSDQPLPPQFVDAAEAVPQPVRPKRSTTLEMGGVAARAGIRPAERSLSFFATLDRPLLVILGILLAIGLIMVYSTTFYWSSQEAEDLAAETGQPITEPDVMQTLSKVIEQGRNMGIGIAVALLVVVFDYRRVRRFAVPLLLVSIATLVAVLLFGDLVFNARRALIGGRFQPGEAAELVMVIYMAAWLSAKNTRVRSLTYGLIPFSVLVGVVCGLVVLQPDLSTAAVIVVVCGAMFFLAGADMFQIAAAAAIVFSVGVVGVLTGSIPFYAQERLPEYFASLTDITEADYHIQQAYIAFVNGGLTGRGLGESLQKFRGLPAPHTDSIFAVIGEELGILGAGMVVLLFVLFITRGLQISQRATDPFGALLAAGVTLLVASKALLNIAVMLGLVPPTGVVLPFISFGGSSLVTLLVGVGLLLSVQRVTLLKEFSPERRVDVANLDHSRGDRRSRVPRTGHSRSDSQTLPRS